MIACRTSNNNNKQNNSTNRFVKEKYLVWANIQKFKKLWTKPNYFVNFGKIWKFKN